MPEYTTDYIFDLQVQGEEAVQTARRVRQDLDQALKGSTEAALRLEAAERSLGAQYELTNAAITSQTRRLSYYMGRLDEVGVHVQDLTGKLRELYSAMSAAGATVFDSLTASAQKAYDDIAGHSIMDDLAAGVMDSFASIVTHSKGTFEAISADARRARRDIVDLLAFEREMKALAPGVTWAKTWEMLTTREKLQLAGAGLVPGMPIVGAAKVQAPPTADLVQMMVSLGDAVRKEARLIEPLASYVHGITVALESALRPMFFGRVGILGATTEQYMGLYTGTRDIYLTQLEGQTRQYAGELATTFWHEVVHALQDLAATAPDLLGLGYLRSSLHGEIAARWRAAERGRGVGVGSWAGRGPGAFTVGELAGRKALWEEIAKGASEYIAYAFAGSSLRPGSPALRQALESLRGKELAPYAAFSPRDVYGGVTPAMLRKGFFEAFPPETLKASVLQDVAETVKLLTEQTEGIFSWSYVPTLDERLEELEGIIGGGWKAMRESAKDIAEATKPLALATSGTRYAKLAAPAKSMVFGPATYDIEECMEQLFPAHEERILRYMNAALADSKAGYALQDRLFKQVAERAKVSKKYLDELEYSWGYGFRQQPLAPLHLAASRAFDIPLGRRGERDLTRLHKDIFLNVVPEEYAEEVSIPSLRKSLSETAISKLARALTAMSEVTLSELQTLGYTASSLLTVYRGVQGGVEKTGRLGARQRAAWGAPVESWSVSPAAATSFALEGLGEYAARGAVIRALVAAKDVISFFSTGLGSLHEAELVIKGTALLPTPQVIATFTDRVTRILVESGKAAETLAEIPNRYAKLTEAKPTVVEVDQLLGHEIELKYKAIQARVDKLGERLRDLPTTTEALRLIEAGPQMGKRWQREAARQIAERAGVTREFIRQAGSDWSDEIGGAFAFYRSAAKAFKAPLGAWGTAVSEPVATGVRARAREERLERLLTAMYEVTQEQLRRFGIGPETPIHAYRGIMEMFPGERGMTVPPGHLPRLGALTQPGAPLESWSVLPSVGLGYSTPAEGRGVLLHVLAQAKDIVSFYATCMGSWSEFEVVLRGTKLLSAPSAPRVIAEFSEKVARVSRVALAQIEANEALYETLTGISTRYARLAAPEVSPELLKEYTEYIAASKITMSAAEEEAWRKQFTKFLNLPNEIHDALVKAAEPSKPPRLQDVLPVTTALTKYFEQLYGMAEKDVEKAREAALQRVSRRAELGPYQAEGIAGEWAEWSEEVAIEFSLAAKQAFGIPVGGQIKRLMREAGHWYSEALSATMEASIGRTARFLTGVSLETQEQLGSLGIGPEDLVTMYRGLYDVTARAFALGRPTSVRYGAPIQSWTATPEYAFRFAAGEPGPFMFGGGGDEELRGVVLQAQIAAKHIVAFYTAGLGAMHEFELVVIRTGLEEQPPRVIAVLNKGLTQVADDLKELTEGVGTRYAKLAAPLPLGVPVTGYIAATAPERAQISLQEAVRKVEATIAKNSQALSALSGFLQGVGVVAQARYQPARLAETQVGDFLQQEMAGTYQPLTREVYTTVSRLGAVRVFWHEMGHAITDIAARMELLELSEMQLWTGLRIMREQSWGIKRLTSPAALSLLTADIGESLAMQVERWRAQSALAQLVVGTVQQRGMGPTELRALGEAGFARALFGTVAPRVYEAIAEQLAGGKLTGELADAFQEGLRGAWEASEAYKRMWEWPPISPLVEDTRYAKLAAGRGQQGWTWVEEHAPVSRQLDSLFPYYEAREETDRIRAKAMARIAQEAGVATEQVEKLSEYWSQGAFAVTAQVAAAKMLGIPLGDILSQWAEVSEHVDRVRLDVQSLPRILRAMYNETQQQLREIGVGPEELVHVYRGLASMSIRAGGVLGGVHPVLQGLPLQSWSLRTDIPTELMSLDEEQGREARGILLHAQVLAKDIVALYSAGLGARHEFEVLVSRSGLERALPRVIALETEAGLSISSHFRKIAEGSTRYAKLAAPKGRDPLWEAVSQVLPIDPMAVRVAGLPATKEVIAKIAKLGQYSVKAYKLLAKCVVWYWGLEFDLKELYRQTAEVFRIPLGAYVRAMPEGLDLGDDFRALLRALHGETQKALREQGVQFLSLYRGVSGLPAGKYKVGQLLAPRERTPFESWTPLPGVGYIYSASAMYPEVYPGAVSGQGALLRASVPAKDILSLPFTGLGHAEQFETIVLGTRLKVAEVVATFEDGEAQLGALTEQVKLLAAAAQETAQALGEVTVRYAKLAEPSPLVAFRGGEVTAFLRVLEATAMERLKQPELARMKYVEYYDPVDEWKGMIGMLRPAFERLGKAWQFNQTAISALQEDWGMNVMRGLGVHITTLFGAAAAKAFGMELGPRLTEALEGITTKQLNRLGLPLLTTLLKASRVSLLELAQSRGIAPTEAVPLYRGLGTIPTGPAVAPGQVFDMLRGSTITAWSLYPSTAADAALEWFAETVEDTCSLILRATVPVKQIIGAEATGLGWTGLGEVLVSREAFEQGAKAEIIAQATPGLLLTTREIAAELGVLNKQLPEVESYILRYAKLAEPLPLALTAPPRALVPTTTWYRGLYRAEKPNVEQPGVWWSQNPIEAMQYATSFFSAFEKWWGDEAEVALPIRMFRMILPDWATFLSAVVGGGNIEAPAGVAELVELLPELMYGRGMVTAGFADYVPPELFERYSEVFRADLMSLGDIVATFREQGPYLDDWGTGVEQATKFIAELNEVIQRGHIGAYQGKGVIPLPPPRYAKLAAGAQAGLPYGAIPTPLPPGLFAGAQATILADMSAGLTKTFRDIFRGVGTTFSESYMFKAAADVSVTLKQLQSVTAAIEKLTDADVNIKRWTVESAWPQKSVQQVLARGTAANIPIVGVTSIDVGATHRMTRDMDRVAKVIELNMPYFAKLSTFIPSINLVAEKMVPPQFAWSGTGKGLQEALALYADTWREVFLKLTPGADTVSSFWHEIGHAFLDLAARLALPELVPMQRAAVRRVLEAEPYPELLDVLPAGPRAPAYWMTAQHLWNLAGGAEEQLAASVQQYGGQSPVLTALSGAIERLNLSSEQLQRLGERGPAAGAVYGTITLEVLEASIRETFGPRLTSDLGERLQVALQGAAQESLQWYTTAATHRLTQVAVERPEAMLVGGVQQLESLSEAIIQLGVASSVTAPAVTRLAGLLTAGPTVPLLTGGGTSGMGGGYYGGYMGSGGLPVPSTYYRGVTPMGPAYKPWGTIHFDLSTPEGVIGARVSQLALGAPPVTPPPVTPPGAGTFTPAGGWGRQGWVVGAGGRTVWGTLGPGQVSLPPPAGGIGGGAALPPGGTGGGWGVGAPALPPPGGGGGGGGIPVINVNFPGGGGGIPNVAAAAASQGPGILDFLQKFTTGLNKATMQYFGLRRLGYGLESVGRSMERWGQGVIRSMQSAAEAYLAFDKAATFAAAAMELPIEMQGDLEVAIQGVAMQLGAFTATELAEGLRLWAAGTGTVVENQEQLNKVLATTTPIQKLAAMNNVDLGETMTTVGAVMAEFGLKVEDVGMITGVLNYVAAKTFANVNDVGEAFRMVGPVAASMGVSFTEVAAALGLLSDANIKGSMAGRALRQMLMQLLDPTAETNKAMNRLLGTNTALATSWKKVVFPGGEFVGLAKFIDILAAATENYTEQQRSELLAVIATANELPALITLVTRQVEARKTGINVMSAFEKGMLGISDAETEALAGKKVTGAADLFEQQWTRKATSAAFKADMVRRRWEAAIFAIGKATTGVALPAIEQLVGVLQSVAAFVEKHPAVAGAAGVAAVTAIVGGKLIQLVGNIANAASNMLILRGAFLQFGGAVGTFNAAVAAFSSSVGVHAAVPGVGVVAATAGGIAAAAPVLTLAGLTLFAVAIVRTMMTNIKGGVEEGARLIGHPLPEPTEEQLKFGYAYARIQGFWGTYEDFLKFTGIEANKAADMADETSAAYERARVPLLLKGGGLAKAPGMVAMPIEYEEVLAEYQKYLDQRDELTLKYVERAGELEQDRGDRMLEEAADYADRAVELDQEHIDNMVEIAEDGYERRNELIERANERAEDAERNALQRIEDAKEDFLYREQENAIDAAERRQEIIDRYNEWVIDQQDRLAEAEQDHIDRLGEMWEDYQTEQLRAREDHIDRLWDLVASRDARGLLREAREYTKARKRREEDYQKSVERENERWAKYQEEAAKETAKRQEELAKQLAEFDAAEERRQQKAAEALQRQLDEIQRAFERQLEEILRDYTKDSEALDKSIADKQEKEKTAHEERQKKLADAHDERMAKLDENFQKEMDKLGEQHNREMDELNRQSREVINAMVDAIEGITRETERPWQEQLTALQDWLGRQLEILRQFEIDLRAQQESIIDSWTGFDDWLNHHPTLPVPPVGDGDGDGGGGGDGDINPLVMMSYGRNGRAGAGRSGQAGMTVVVQQPNWKFEGSMGEADKAWFKKAAKDAAFTAVAEVL